MMRALTLVLAIGLFGEAAAAPPGPWRGDPCGYARRMRWRGTCTDQTRWVRPGGDGMFTAYLADGGLLSNVRNPGMPFSGLSSDPDAPPPPTWEQLYDEAIDRALAERGEDAPDDPQ